MGLAVLLKKASLAGAFFVAAIWQLPALAFCSMSAADQAKVQTVAVRQVIDGDTLRLNNGSRVRLIGINAPEIGRKGETSEPFAEAARQQLQALVKASGGRVELLPGAQPRDKYGRTLAHVFGRSGDNFEAQLLRQGLAVRVAVPPNTAFSACQQQAEQAARQAGTGVWQRPLVVAPGQLRKAGFALIRAQVRAIKRNSGGIWIELEGPLVLQVPPRQVENFSPGFTQGLEGHSIEARGWVLDRSRKGGSMPGQARWLLPLTDPSMLERQERQ